MTSGERLEAQWLNHIDTEFPRRVNTPKSEIVYTPERYLYLIWRHLLLSPIWVGIYAHEDIKIQMYDKFAVDLDHETDLELVHMDMMTLRNYSLHEFGREPRLFFSGRKGFHVYFDFYPLKIKIDNFQNTFKVFVRDLEKELGVTTIDHHCIEPNRVLRLPFTPHEKSKRWCIPIHPEWSLKKILRESICLEDCWNIDTSPVQGDDRFVDVIKACRDRAVEREKIPNKFPEFDTQTIDTEIDVLRNLAPFVTDGRHRILHYMIVPRMVHAGYSVWQTHAFCKEWIEETRKNYHDYRDYVTRSFERNKQWTAWSFSRFFSEYPDLALPLVEVLKEVKKDDCEENS